MPEIKKGYKQTDVGVIPEDWEVKTLGDIADVRKGAMITSRDIIYGNIPVIAGGIKPANYHKQSNRKARCITVSASGANAGYVAYHNYPIFASVYYNRMFKFK